MSIMSDYIKKEDAIKSIQKHDLANDCNGSKEWAEWLLEDVKPADVVEVVRCRDCIHNGQCKHRVVMWIESPMNTWHKDIDFCSYGKRKEREHE